MFIHNWKKEILTVPNLLSLVRLIMIPACVGLYLRAKEPAQFFTAGTVVALSCLTDALDGWIARHFNMVSTLGKILDPLADKLTQFALTVCLSLRYELLNPVLALFVIKEVLQMSLGIVYFFRGQILPGALPAGKICTAVLFVSLILLILFPDVPEPLISAIALVNGILLVISFSGYCSAYCGQNPKIQDLGNEDLPF